MEKIIFEKYYGESSYGEVRLIDNKYHCFTTPTYGGYWILEEIFDDKQDAIDYIENVT
jgi:hypothetical protein